MAAVVEEEALPQRLRDLRAALHWVYGICWNGERNRFEVEDRQEFNVRYLRLKELLLECSMGDLDDLAVHISYNEIPLGSMSEWCDARKIVFNALVELQESYRAGVL